MQRRDKHEKKIINIHYGCRNGSFNAYGLFAAEQNTPEPGAAAVTADGGAIAHSQRRQAMLVLQEAAVQVEA